jgi:hypothetical protein
MRRARRTGRRVGAVMVAVAGSRAGNRRRAGRALALCRRGAGLPPAAPPVGRLQARQPGVTARATAPRPHVADLRLPLHMAGWARAGTVLAAHLDPAAGEPHSAVGDGAPRYAPRIARAAEAGPPASGVPGPPAPRTLPLSSRPGAARLSPPASSPRHGGTAVPVSVHADGVSERATEARIGRPDSPLTGLGPRSRPGGGADPAGPGPWVRAYPYRPPARPAVRGW